MSLFKKAPVVAAEDKEFHGKARDYENDADEKRDKSERRAWLVAGVSVALSFVMAISIAVLVGKFKPFAFLVEMDKATGETSVVMPMGDGTFNFPEMNDKFNIKRYVIARESYFYSLLQINYDLTINMSCDDVGSEYAKLYDGDNALDKVLGSGTEYRVKVLSIRLPKDQPGNAVVSFEKSTWKGGAKDPGPAARYIATLSYKNTPTADVKKKESVWIDNPTGYKTCAYRVDPELAGGR